MMSAPPAHSEDSTLVALVRRRASEQPEQTVYTFLLDGETDQVHLTYRQVDQRARAIAALLQSRGAGGERALLLYPPGLDYITAFFGCLYANVVAVPVYPPDPLRLNRTLPRLQAIVADAQASLALTTAPILAMAEMIFDQAPDLKALNWVATDELDDGQALAEMWQAPAASGETLAFLQYTSGSTAAPKGVQLSHRNLLHNLAAIYTCFGHSPNSRGVIWLPPYHDMGLIGGILQPLYGGFPVVLMSPVDFLKKPLRWLQAVSRYRATTSGGPNFAYDLCVRKITPEQRAALDLSCWDLAFNGAEPIRPETLERFVEAFGPCGFRKEAFYPCYGLAEATLISSGGIKTRPPVTLTVDGAALKRSRVQATAPTRPEAQTLVGCGQSLSDQRVVIAHPDTRRLCPPDQVGEIWLAGPSVAQGYWQRPQETEQTFQAYLADTHEGPFLRTGDLGFVYDGELFVAGRLKDMIIIRGHNHYPQDIEHTVELCHPALRPGCGAAFSVEVEGEERLVVTHELDRRAANLDPDEVIRAIRQAVADQHEVQVYGVLLLEAGSIPKTSSGKIQRHACRAGFLSDSLDVVAKSLLDVAPTEAPPARPEPSFICKALQAIQDQAARRSLLTLYLQENVARVLRVPAAQVLVQQPLGSLGLDSLMAIELKHELETSLGVDVPMTDLLQAPGLAELAALVLARLDAPPGGAALATSQAEGGEHPLSCGQQALWFLYQLAPTSAAYNVPSAVRIRSPLDVPALQRAFEKLAARHAALRTTFGVSSEGPVQRVHAQATVDFESVDASTWSEAALDQRLAEEAHRPFDLERGPLWRVRVFKRSEREYCLLVTMHHIITDFWSLAILVNELDRLYPAECAGRSVTLPPVTLQYSDYARWQAEMLEGPRGQQLWAYWQEQLAGDLPVLHLPTDHPRPPVQTYNGRIHTIQLSAELTEQLKALSQAQGATLNMTLLAAFQVLLYRYTGQTDFTVGSVAAGRSQAEMAGTVGYFVNPIVLRARPSPTQTFAAFLQQTRQTMLAAFDHQDYAFTRLVDRLQPIRDYSRSPLFQVMFAFQRAYKLHDEGLTAFGLDIAGARAEVGGLQLESMTLEHRVAQFDLTLTMGEAHGELVASFEYNSDLFETETIVRMAAHFQTLLEEIALDPQRRLASVSLLPEAEWWQLLDLWQSAQVQYSRDTLILELFEPQAERTPDTIAVVCGDEHLTYRALDQRADRLAAYLQGLGVGAGVFVGLCMERSLEMIVGVMGILKAGGAYVPLDPASPAERLEFMLTETRTGVLLTKIQACRELGLPQVRVLYLDKDWAAIASGQASTVPLSRQATGQNAACIIYTSGSTGRPKGVVLEHRGLVNLVHSFIQSYQPTVGDKILPLTSVSSSSFVGEILPLLCVGGTLVLPGEDEILDVERLVALIAQQAVSIVSTVPTVVASLNMHKEDLPHVRLVLSGGEALVASDVDRLLGSVTIVNGYGLTETTICSTFYNMESQDFHSRAWVPIGRPIINTEVYVLDPYLNCLPIGCRGELYVGGDGLARGYWQNPELTAERFIPNPYRPGERMYRTGDAGRWLPNGNLEYLHRVDHQVKIRGFRIETGEVEAMIKQHPSVRDAFVMVRGDGGPDEPDLAAAAPSGRDLKRLVAYVVPTNPGLTSSDLHRWLTDRLPLYMIPAAFEMLEALPLSPNGKVDTRALPTPGGLRPSLMATFVAPQSEMERRLASIWQAVLKLDQIGIHDNFFELGGNSLLIAQVQHRLRAELNDDIPLVNLFKYPTIHSLATHLAQKQPAAPAFGHVKDEAKKRQQAMARRKQHAEKRGHG